MPNGHMMGDLLGRNWMTQFLKRLWLEEEAQDLFEYALILFLISLIVVTAMGGLAARINHAYSNASTRVAAADNGPSLSGGSLGGASALTHTAFPAKEQNKPHRN